MHWLQELRPTSLADLWHVGSSWSRDRTHVPCIGRQILNHWTTRWVHKILNFKQLCFKIFPGTSLVVQWLRLCTPNARGQGLIPGQRTRSHMPQLKILHVSTKTRYIQINRYSFKKILSVPYLGLFLFLPTSINCKLIYFHHVSFAHLSIQYYILPHKYCFCCSQLFYFFGCTGSSLLRTGFL